ncbi:PadR family transcriptional regulator [Glaciihabitans sp. UYNi722]|uniref:PadR family transcriptional regulator n=1 Tax=Glaciihabitans sp. UYNi722 TaxID=3156344 RepID=UPI003399CB66
MSVRDGLLAILTLGPAYGLQLHSELASRAPHRKPVNVGQIYGTLERLAKQGLIEPAGLTDDALPLYRLTEAGKNEATGWMSEPVIDALPEWTEMLDQVLVASSIDPVSAKRVAQLFRRWWETDLEHTRRPVIEGSFPTDAHLALVAREAQAVAAIAWLGSAISALSENDSIRGLSDVRPRRGRRPRA